MKNLALIIILLFSLTSVGQNNNCKSTEKPYIEVNGTAKKEINPDEIYITIRIRDYKKLSKESIIEQEKKLIVALKDLNIDYQKDLYLSDTYANYAKVSLFKTDVVTRKQYILKVSNAEQVGQVFKKLAKMKAYYAWVSKVSHSKIEQFKKEVEIAAIKAAKEKADYLLNAIGEKAGHSLVIKELESSPRNANYHQENALFLANGIKTKEKIQFKKIVIQKTFYLKIAIEE